MSSRRKELAELRANRAAGKTRLTTYEVQEQEKLYEEVDEEGYKKVVRKRLDQDDFVIDDNGRGYADDGREAWYDERNGESETESDDGLPALKKTGKRKRDEDHDAQQKIDQGISKYLSRGAQAAKAKPKPKLVATAEDDAFIADLLYEVDNNASIRKSSPPPPIKRHKSENIRKSRVLSPPLSDTKPTRPKPAVADDGYLPETPPIEERFEGDDDDCMPLLPYMDTDDVLPQSDSVLPSSPTTKAVERKPLVQTKPDDEDIDDDLMEVEPVVGHSGIASANVNISASRPARNVQKTVYPSPESSSPTRPAPEAVDASAWNSVTTKLNVLSSNPATETASHGKLNAQDVLEDDGNLRMFWMDYTEVNGSLCLFGKVKNRSNGRYASCFVKVDNILRKLYFLPREYRHRNGRDTDEEVEMNDVYEEVDGLMSKSRVGMHKIKPCSRKYAFELPDVPREADYLKLLYPYDKPALSMDIRGETFSHIFGTNTALFEQFVLWRNIKGPCWLKIEDANCNALHNASWCKFEVLVSKPGKISTLGDSEDMEAPPLTLMSLALRTTLNVKENKQEILVASARVYENLSLSDTTPTDQLPCQTFTVVRPAGQAYPVGFEAETKKHKGVIRLEKNESMLLSSFLAKIQQYDPDVFVGHQLEGVDYSILLNRMRERKTPGWHRVGRLRRSEWPKNMGRLGGSFFAERQLVSGRLLCDLANDLGKSLMTKCQSWSLSEMCELVLGGNNTRREIDNEAALNTWAKTRKGLMNYLTHCEADTHFIAAIALKVQMLPLTKVLTNLAGNSWARTLSGTRAERNEYILLHEFHKNKYLCPDKIYGKGRNQKADDEMMECEEGSADVKKKDKFKGGLVFEPEKGLYDKFILVMDFNSLYPSIIQEFNICFTTVERSDGTVGAGEDEEKVPAIPAADQAQGILPRLIATLVNRRRQVKSLMKNKRATADELATWDIKQLALKLTANSMYGCLGYTKSRFYARPLAMLTTSKGREILRSTKDLAESSQLRVIYGDTDSVMINTNATSIEDALKVGNEFKRAVNERYQLLEIDIDNIFRRLLLHAKKKYAAINMAEVDGKYVDKLEVKGLDMRRREYCALSKEVSSKLLNEILSGEEAEVVVEKVHDILRDVSQKMREDSIPAQKYIIYTKLGKNPKEYPNPDSMPQVQVALRAMAQGKTIRVNDVMAYIVTGDSKTSSENAAKRAYSPQDVLKPDSGLKPDIEYYLHKQLFPPVERLCAPIEGTSSLHLAECLGLDTRKYAIHQSSSSGQSTFDISPLESQIPDNIRFADCTPLTLRCRSKACGQVFPFHGLLDSHGLCAPTGLACPTCHTPLPTLTVVAQLEHAVRAHTARYYDGWLVCDDAACGNRTRQVSVYGHRCLGARGRASGCLGRMRYEYSEKMLYTQLLFWQGLWDVDGARRKVGSVRSAAAGENGELGEKELKEKVLALVEHNRVRFGTCKAVVDRYLDKCGRRWVAMDGLFGFALKG